MKSTKKKTKSKAYLLEEEEGVGEPHLLPIPALLEEAGEGVVPIRRTKNIRLKSTRKKNKALVHLPLLVEGAGEGAHLRPLLPREQPC